MTYEQRVDLYKQIESERERPLIAYVTSSRQNAEGVMASDVVPEFCKQIQKIPNDSSDIDLLIVSRGGDPIVSWRIISLLRERFEKVGVLIPYEAYSAATLLALGADEIVMHPFSNLGPVDPQLHIVRNVDGKQEKLDFASEDLTHFLDFVNKDVGISDQEQKERAFEFVCKEVGAIPIGAAKRSSNLALSLGEKLLGLHMSDHNKIRAISEALNKSFYHHGYPVGRKEAKNMDLKIIDASETLEKLIWDVWENIETEMKCKEPFNPVTVIMQNSSLSPKDQSIQQVKYDLFHATVESTRVRSEYKKKLQISALRMPDMNININVSLIDEGWKMYSS